MIDVDTIRIYKRHIINRVIEAGFDLPFWLCYNHRGLMPLDYEEMKQAIVLVKK